VYDAPEDIPVQILYTDWLASFARRPAALVEAAAIARLDRVVAVNADIPDRLRPNYVNAYPVKLFEYMAAGIPIVATDVPRWREVLEMHACGVGVPAHPSRALAAAITGLLDDGKATRAGSYGSTKSCSPERRSP
jgi:hypothetical protein